MRWGNFFMDKITKNDAGDVTAIEVCWELSLVHWRLWKLIGADDLYTPTFHLPFPSFWDKQLSVKNFYTISLSESNWRQTPLYHWESCFTYFPLSTPVIHDFLSSRLFTTHPTLTREWRVDQLSDIVGASRADSRDLDGYQLKFRFRNHLHLLTSFTSWIPGIIHR